MSDDQVLFDEFKLLNEPPAVDQEVLDVIYGPGSGKRAPTKYDIAIMVGLQRMSLYQGTVPPGVVAERRRKNKLARAARRINRGNR